MSFFSSNWSIRSQITQSNEVKNLKISSRDIYKLSWNTEFDVHCLEWLWMRSVMVNMTINNDISEYSFSSMYNKTYLHIAECQVNCPWSFQRPRHSLYCPNGSHDSWLSFPDALIVFRMFPVNESMRNHREEFQRDIWVEHSSQHPMIVDEVEYCATVSSLVHDNTKHTFKKNDA